MDDTFDRSRNSSDHNKALSSTESAKEAFEVITHRKWWVLAALLVALVIVTVNHLLQPSFATQSFIFADSDQETSGFQELLSTLGGNKSGGLYNEAEAEKQLLLLRSAGFYRRVAAELHKDPEMATFLPKIQENIRDDWNPLTILTRNRRAEEIASSDVLLGEFVERHSTVTLRGRGILRIQMAANQRELTVFLMNVFLDTAVKALSERESKKLTAASSFIQNKIEETLKKMEGTDHDILGLSRKGGGASLLAPQATISERLLDLKLDIEKFKVAYEQNLKTIESLRAKVASSPDTDSSGNPVLNSAMGGLYGLRKTIANLEVENELLSSRIQVMKNGLAELLKSNMSLPRQEMLLADLKRQKELGYYVFDTLFKTHLQLEVRGVSLLSRVYPLQKTTLDEVFRTTRLGPKLLTAALIALVLSCAAAHFWQLISPLLRTKRDFEGLDASFMGSIPLIPHSYLGPADSDLARPLCKFEIESKETTAFKHIRSRLIHLSNFSGTSTRKVISLLSYGNGEGKTLLSLNLARCFAFMGKKTVLLDFDLRRASLTKFFSLAAEAGLCENLNEGASLESLVQRDVYPGLDFIPAGEFNSSTAEKLSNSVFQDILNQLKSKYDFVIIDTAPILVAHESIVIARETDFAILVATCWKTRREHIREALEEIRSVRRETIHFMLNKVKDTNISLVNSYYYVGGGSLGRRRAAEAKRSHNVDVGVGKPVAERSRPLDN